MFNRAGRVLLTHPDMRIVRFPPAQVDAFRTYDDDLAVASSDARPPFTYSFFDFGFVEVGGYEVVGVALFDDPDNGGWKALGFARQVQTDDWTTVFLSAEGMTKGVEGRVGILEPQPDRPPTGDMIKALTLMLSGALLFLESTSVDLVSADPLPRAHQAAAIPHYDVVVRQATRRYLYEEQDHATIQWSHRWEVRGHFKHFRRGPLFERYPEKRITTAAGDVFVRVWCPPHIKGPDGKPLVVKSRSVAASRAPEGGV